mmetsp:Transcript_15831/g.23977  ORF Transcript_15831/g.23977 Transcript_15831/m.23977 type:complete len:216 (+) Transcript_15831:656-1303(+)
MTSKQSSSARFFDKRSSSLLVIKPQSMTIAAQQRTQLVLDCCEFSCCSFSSQAFWKACEIAVRERVSSVGNLDEVSRSLSQKATTLSMRLSDSSTSGLVLICVTIKVRRSSDNVRVARSLAKIKFFMIRDAGFRYLDGSDVANNTKTSKACSFVTLHDTPKKREGINAFINCSGDTFSACIFSSIIIRRFSLSLSLSRTSLMMADTTEFSGVLVV